MVFFWFAWFSIKSFRWTLCWDKYINRKSIDRLLIHADIAHYIWHIPEEFFIWYVHISHVKSLVSIDTYVWTLKTFPGILSFECQYIEGISDMSFRVLWQNMARSYKCKEHPLMGNYSLVERHMVILYDPIE